mmetsp:Transcript_25905/g.55699  ORF Transcript_25905/g.55699 Transcript_25905/m.55699 type:complete len:122 (+) Transcript_25905:155-520(+)
MRRLYCDRLSEASLPDSVESIGENAFYGCNFPCFRIPPLVSHIAWRTVSSIHSSTFSIEVPKNLEELNCSNQTFSLSLRKLPSHKNAKLGEVCFPLIMRHVTQMFNATPPKYLPREVLQKH